MGQGDNLSPYRPAPVSTVTLSAQSPTGTGFAMPILPDRLHASLRRDEPLATAPLTGEIRVPLALYEVDELLGATDLVLARSEAQDVFTRLAEALGYVKSAPTQRGLEAMR